MQLSLFLISLDVYLHVFDFISRRETEREREEKGYVRRRRSSTLSKEQFNLDVLIFVFI